MDERLARIVRIFASANPYGSWYPAENCPAGVVCRWCMERAHTPEECQHDHECLWRQARELVAEMEEQTDRARVAASMEEIAWVNAKMREMGEE